MLYHKVKVIRDVNTVYNRAVPSWELPVLTFIFDEGNVQPTETFEIVDRSYPDAGVEYDRLIRRYGADVKSGVPFAASVFGVGVAGIRAVQGIIDEARADEAERQEAGTLPKRRYALVPQHLAAQDALLA
jgi:hypothetical protein